MASHNDLGRWGEEVAAEYLQAKGFRIVARDWKDGHRDLDIVAVDSDMLVVVEVKTRRNNMFAEPEQAVDRRKIRSLCTAANKYVKICGINLPVRFDVVTVTGTPETGCEINHVEDAFLPLPY